MEPKKVFFIIMDGFGIGEDNEYNATKVANTPNLDKIRENSLYTQLSASGTDVGLPKGIMGNSEVGHLNIGAGRIVYQDIVKIDRMIEDGSFFRNEVLLKLMNNTKSNNSSLHLIGLVSDGCVHSSLEHLRAILETAKREDVKNVFLHAFTDGRDTAPKSGIGFIKDVERDMKEIGVGRIATVMGRYHGMDRDNRWERIEKAYRTLVNGEGKMFSSAEEAVSDSYKNDVTDEFIIPSIIVDDGKPVSTLENGDSVLFFNYRADRARQLTRAINEEGFDEFQRVRKNVFYATMTIYDESFDFPVIFPSESLTNILGEVLSKNGIPQLRISETEKYAHVTYFFNGGGEKPFKLEDRILIPSPKIATYDLQPEMSAYELTERALKEIKEDKHVVSVLNFPNCDMVGHTGVFKAAVRAVETVDECVGKLVKANEERGAVTIISADHGNSEKMWDFENNLPHTAHTTNPVPFFVLNFNGNAKIREHGILADIAPTILHILGISLPDEMTGKSLLL
ncbi:2,3-bisphosphoglycerate-independent phosphoglycerate mutase [candidate division KSB1 bacterium]